MNYILKHSKQIMDVSNSVIYTYEQAVNALTTIKNACLEIIEEETTNNTFSNEELDINQVFELSYLLDGECICEETTKEEAIKWLKETYKDSELEEFVLENRLYEFFEICNDLEIEIDY